MLDHCVSLLGEKENVSKRPFIIHVLLSGEKEKVSKKRNDLVTRTYDIE